MASEREIRVLIVDDHTVVRKGLIALLSAPKYGIEVVGEAQDGTRVLAKVRELNPDVILMDLFMPGMDGVETTRLVRQEFPKARILILTSSGEQAQVSRAVKAGALGYILKDASPDELVNAISSVDYAQFSLPQELAQQLLLSEEISAHTPDVVELTEREKDVMRLIAEGMSNKQIASALSISTTTVRTHVSNILRKLDLENRTQIALYARQK